MGATSSTDAQLLRLAQRLAAARNAGEVAGILRVHHAPDDDVAVVALRSVDDPTPDPS